MVTPIKANVIRSARPPQASRKHFAAAGNAQGGFPFRAPKRNSKLFGTCASVYARRNVEVSWTSIGSIMPKPVGALCHVAAYFEEEQTSE